ATEAGAPRLGRARPLRAFQQRTAARPCFASTPRPIRSATVVAPQRPKLVPRSRAWPNVRVSRPKCRPLLTLVLTGSCARSPPPAATPELELEPPTTANEQPAPATRETSHATPPELQPCSEANPGGCTAPKAPRAKL